jgi:hypothetical protein
MKVKKSVLWSVLAFLTGFVGILSALATVGYAVWRTIGGYNLSEVVNFNVLGFSFYVSLERFIFAAAVSVALIVVSIICSSIGKAVYRKRVKAAIEEARLANSSKGMFNLSPEMQEQVAQTAKKLIPVVATVAVACAVAGIIKKSQAKKRREEMQMSRYYPY